MGAISLRRLERCVKEGPRVRGFSREKRRLGVGVPLVPLVPSSVRRGDILSDSPLPSGCTSAGRSSEGLVAAYRGTMIDATREKVECLLGIGEAVI